MDTAMAGELIAILSQTCSSNRGDMQATTVEYKTGADEWDFLKMRVQLTEFFKKAEKLSRQDPLPDDIIKQLDAYFELIPEEEKDDFLWLYEAVELQINLVNPNQ